MHVSSKLLSTVALLSAAIGSSAHAQNNGNVTIYAPNGRVYSGGQLPQRSQNPREYQPPPAPLQQSLPRARTQYAPQAYVQPTPAPVVQPQPARPNRVVQQTANQTYVWNRGSDGRLYTQNRVGSLFVFDSASQRVVRLTSAPRVQAQVPAQPAQSETPRIDEDLLRQVRELAEARARNHSTDRDNCKRHYNRYSGH